MSLFRLDASILPGTSASTELADLLEPEWSAARPPAGAAPPPPPPPRPPRRPLRRPAPPTTHENRPPPPPPPAKEGIRALAPHLPPHPRAAARHIGRAIAASY